MKNRIKHFLAKCKVFSCQFIFCSILFLIGCGDSQLSELNFSNEASGCADFLVYTYGDDDTALTVRGARESLGLSTETQTIQLPDERITVTVNVFDGPIGSYYCDDVAGNEGSIVNQYEATSGQIDLQITQDSIQFDFGDVIYELQISLKNVEFEVEGESLQIDQLQLSEAVVGWLPG